MSLLLLLLLLLLFQTRQATKSFSTNDWCKKFCIEFQGEEGELYPNFFIWAGEIFKSIYFKFR